MSAGGRIGLVGFADDCIGSIAGTAAAPLIQSDPRFGSSVVCLPLDLSGQNWVAAAPRLESNRYQVDAMIRARSFGTAVAMIADVGCQTARLIPPSESGDALPCLVEAFERIDMMQAPPQLDLSLFPETTQMWARRIATGKSLARRVTETTPDVSVAEQVSAVETALKAAGVTVERLGPEDVRAQYPLCAAVSAATWNDPDRRAEILRIQIGDAAAPRAVFLAGKGVVMDVGGIDLKPAGQFGMSRDKGGAGAVAGFLLAAAQDCPKDLCIHAELAFSWNGIGGSAITPDHCLTAASGLRVQVGNTDAEGRLILSDVLCSLLAQRQDCSAERADFIAVATLTGHAGRSFGARTVLIGDDEFRTNGTDQNLFEACARLGERSALSPLQPEDWDRAGKPNEGIDLIGATSQNSLATPRGHQYPAAIMKTASGWFLSPRPAGDGFLLADIAGANTRSDLPKRRAACPMVGGLIDHYLIGPEALT